MKYFILKKKSTKKNNFKLTISETIITKERQKNKKIISSQLKNDVIFKVKENKKK